MARSVVPATSPPHKFAPIAKYLVTHILLNAVPPQVEASDQGHEGAGEFDDTLWCLDSQTFEWVEVKIPPSFGSWALDSRLGSGSVDLL